jgi:hypothetical protein
MYPVKPAFPAKAPPMARIKADIRELVGISVNSSALVVSRGEGDLDRVAAVGAASLEISVGADMANLPVAAMAGEIYRRSADMRDVMLDPGTPDDRDQVVGELAPMLWHIREGKHESLVMLAIPLFARWLSGRRLLASVESSLLQRFAGRVLHEWLSDRCIICGGTGRLELTRTGTLIRPRGNMQRNARFTTCRTRGGGGCQGTGRAQASHTERIRWLQIERVAYEAERWAQRFNAGQTWLSFLIHRRLYRPLTGQLERRKKRI